MVSTPEKCAKPHSDIESTQISSLNLFQVPENLSNQKIQKKKVLHAGTSEQNGLILITGFSSMQEGRIKQKSIYFFKDFIYLFERESHSQEGTKL